MNFCKNNVESFVEAGTSRCNVQPEVAAERPSKGAFSLIEILVTVALLSFIIIGLVLMFNQTRRAFVSSMTQVDVLESGRMATDMIAREIEQLAATSPAGKTNLVNFLVITNANYPATLMAQPLVDPTDLRTNNITQLYFVTRNNQQWNTIGYRLSGADYSSGIGTLYRFSTNNISFTNTAVLAQNNGLPLLFLQNDPTSGSGYWSRVIDGVVDFRVSVFDMKGNKMTNGLTSNITPSGSISLTNSSNGEYLWEQFYGDALPAYVEIELGVLEDRALAHYRALSNLPPPTAWAYLTNHAAQVHIFRQRIPIRDVNPSFYP